METGSIVVSKVTVPSSEDVAPATTNTTETDCQCHSKKAMAHIMYARRFYRFKMFTNAVQTVAAILTILAIFKLVNND